MGRDKAVSHFEARMRSTRDQLDLLPVQSETVRGKRTNLRMAGAADEQPEQLGFGLCFLYLRNVKGLKWNHKRICRISRDLELNLKIKPCYFLVLDKPLTLALPTEISGNWSMDFTRDQLVDGRSVRLFNVIDDFNRRRIGIKVDLSLLSERNPVARLYYRMARQAIRCYTGPDTSAR